MSVCSNSALGQNKPDYRKAGMFILENLFAKVPKEKLDYLEDSIFIKNPILSSHSYYISSFKNYFIIRSNTPQYVRNIKNQGVQITNDNRLAFMLREAEELGRMDLVQLASLSSYKYAYHQKSISAQKMISGFRKINQNAINEIIKEYSEVLIENHGWLADKNIPDFSMTDSSGDLIQLSKIAEPYILLDFWFVGCKPCMQDIPLLEEIKTKYSNRIKILSVNSVDTKEQVLSWISKESYRFPVIILDSNSESIKYFKPQQYPTYHLISNDLRIIETDLELKKIEMYLKDSD